MVELQQRRDFFARLITAQARAQDPRLQAAFRETRREDFLGPGPWRAFTAGGYLDIPPGDAGLVYQDVPIALDAARGINNGQPSLHAVCLAALAPREGEHALHIGAGTGYYTAILARLVGAERAGGGEVDAYEIEPDLAKRAAANLEAYPGVRVHARSGVEEPLPRADVIYVSAGASGPAPAWLAALRPGGRLLFPLTGARGTGMMLLATRGENPQAWAARLLIPVAFIPCTGSPQAGEQLEAALERGGWREVRSLRIGTPPDASAWYRGAGWWLSTQPAEAVSAPQSGA